MHTSHLKVIVPVIILAVFFVFATYLGNIYGDVVENYLRENNFVLLGYVVYVILMILATVVAPLSTLPFMPIATGLWGAFTTALLSILGWSLGALGAFYISRRYGMPVVEKFVSKEKIERINEKIPKNRNLLMSIIVLRMIMPVDVLSYALGIFPRITWRPYIIGTIIGVIPFSFVFAYLGGLPITFQVIVFVVLAPILLWIWFRKVNT